MNDIINKVASLGGTISTTDISHLSEYKQVLRAKERGDLIRLRHGVYAAPEALLNTMIDVERIIPNGVVCLYNAWTYHQLSTTVPPAFCIAIANKRKVVLPHALPIELYYWKKENLEFGIMDADITGPSIPRLLALTNQHAYGNEKQQLIPIESKEGIKVMSLNFLVQSESDPVIWRGPVIGGVVKQFYTDVVWGDLDVLLIDMPPGTGDVALTIMQSIPVQGVVMVSTPQPMVSMIVEKACHMCEKMEVKVLGIIENMAYLECPNCRERIEFYKKEDVEALCNSTCTKLYGTLPMLDLIRDINEYDAYSKEQQEKVDAYVSDIATEVLEDIA